MKYSISIDQVGIVKAGLTGKTDLVDWALIDYLIAWRDIPEAKTHTDEKGNKYVWCNYTHLIKEMPLLGITTKGALSRRVTKLENLKLLDTTLINERLYIYVTPVAVSVRFHREHPAPEELQAPDLPKAGTDRCPTATGTTPTVADGQRIRVSVNSRESVHSMAREEFSRPSTPSSPQSETTGTSTIQDLPLQDGIIEPPDLDKSGPRDDNPSEPPMQTWDVGAPRGDTSVHVEVIPAEFEDLFPNDGQTFIDDRQRKPRTAEGNAVETMRALAGSARHAQAWTLKAASFRSMQDRLARCHDRPRVMAIGQALDDVGLEPTWSSRPSTARWIDEIEGLLEVAHGNEGLVVRAIGDAVRENAQRGYPLTYKGPHSFEGAVKKELMKRATTDSNGATPVSRRITVDEW